MVILQVVSNILIAIMLMNMLAKARPLLRVPMPGKTHAMIPAGLVSKLFIYRFSLSTLLTGCVFGVTAGWLPLNIAEMVGVFVVVILLMPMQFTFTSQGVGIGKASFYPWSDFSGFKAKGSRLELAHPSKFGRLMLFIKPAEMGAVLRHVAQHIKIQSSNLSKGE
jgi:hypothetical protein